MIEQSVRSKAKIINDNSPWEQLPSAFTNALHVCEFQCAYVCFDCNVPYALFCFVHYPYASIVNENKGEFKHKHPLWMIMRRHSLIFLTFDMQ